MLIGIEFKDEYTKQELVEKAQDAKESVCELWDALAKHVPELHEIQERRRYYRRDGYGMNGMGGGATMGNPYGWNGNVGYRNYGGGYGMAGYGGYRENPAWTGPGDRRGY